MSREILFKAKGQTSDKWYEGLLTRLDKDVCHIKDKNHKEWICDPFTICQYTGLTDKNGKKIWENDRCCVQRPGVLVYGTIKYLEGCFCFVEDKTGNMLRAILRLCNLRLCNIRENSYSIKVEGNIFDKT